MSRFTHYLKAICLTFLIVLTLSFSVSAASSITPAQVNNLKVTSSGTTAKLTWSKASDAKYYYVYQVNKETGKNIKTLKKLTSTSLSIKNLKEGSTYSFRVRAISKTSTYGPYSEIASTTIKYKKPATPQNFKVSSYQDKGVVLKWSRVSSVTGYTVYLYNTETKEYEPYEDIDSSEREIKIKKLEDGTSYKFIVKSYRKVKGTRIYSDSSNVVTAKITSLPDDVKNIREPRYTVTVKSKVVAVDNSGNSITLKSGTKLTVTSKYSTTVTGYLSDGTKIKVKRSALKYTGLDSSAKNDYSKSLKEKFVNLKGFSSKTNYFIWVSEYKFKVNIFKGSQGKWKLQKEYPCCVGKWSTRTSSGLRSILKKIPNGEYGGPKIYFTSGEGSHDDPQGCSFHNYVDGSRNKAVSHGCVRMSVDSLWYIYNNCPLGTPVYVF